MCCRGIFTFSSNILAWCLGISLKCLPLWDTGRWLVWHFLTLIHTLDFFSPDWEHRYVLEILSSQRSWSLITSPGGFSGQVWSLTLAVLATGRCSLYTRAHADVDEGRRGVPILHATCFNFSSCCSRPRGVVHHFAANALLGVPLLQKWSALASWSRCPFRLNWTWHRLLLRHFYLVLLV